MIDSQDQYALREANSEIRRNQKLIAELQDALEWSLELAREYAQNGRLFSELKRYERYKKLLDRQI